MLSLFGPRHGRLLQANFDNSGTLNVWSSPIYNFADNNEKLNRLSGTTIANPEMVKSLGLSLLRILHLLTPFIVHSPLSPPVARQ
jgi:hypothetical protein